MAGRPEGYPSVQYLRLRHHAGLRGSVRHPAKYRSSRLRGPTNPSCLVAVAGRDSYPASLVVVAGPDRYALNSLLQKSSREVALSFQSSSSGDSTVG